MSLENNFDISFVASVAKNEKQIQQNYRPIIGIHKWFARRPGTVFRNLLLSEYDADQGLSKSFWESHSFSGLIADPFMGGGTPVFEANRLGFSIIGTDINPMAFWIVRQSLDKLDLSDFNRISQMVCDDLDARIGKYYQTICKECGSLATIKYFLWAKTEKCPFCNNENILMPGFLLAEAVRHPKNVLLCRHCGELNEFETIPSHSDPETCFNCKKQVSVEGIVKRQKCLCTNCNKEFVYPINKNIPPQHKLIAMEYYCSSCKENHKGRFFKKPDEMDLTLLKEAINDFKSLKADLPIPLEAIPFGDETLRLHRWGYHFYKDMFNERQLLGLGLLLLRIDKTDNVKVRNALLTVFSDFLRYQNMLCRYDTYALKCQDIFSVHSFPVGLVQCENNLLGISKVGSGSFRHFIEKYRKAKEYCYQPFEIKLEGKKKKVIPIPEENIIADLVKSFPSNHKKEAWILATNAVNISLAENTLDGVFTDPPYFDNVQYAELIDFCYVWLRTILKKEFKEFERNSTRSEYELTGNTTLQRDLKNFTQGLSNIFCHYAKALKVNAPFVFTYHHNDPLAYMPLIVSILDANLNCSVVYPVPAEMGASLHISGTKSSVLDSVFVCRKNTNKIKKTILNDDLFSDIKKLETGGIKVTEGDLRCIASGHIAKLAINELSSQWNYKIPIEQRIKLAEDEINKYLPLINQFLVLVS